MKYTFSINNFIDVLARFSADNDGVTRLPFTAASKAAFEYIKSEMNSLGLKVFSDKYGTIQGHLDGKKEESIIIASHYDSVINGGKYDGVAGIAVGLAVIDYFISNHIVPSYSIDIIALNDEEGIKFNSGFTSSKAITETLKEISVVDNEGNTLSELCLLNLYGNDDITLSSTLKNTKGFIEVHIEQGCILENNHCEIGIVDNIVGIKRYHVMVKGSSGHAGTTPMEYRSDALCSACKIICDLQTIPEKYPDMVLTVGYMKVSPNAVNVIPDNVVFSIDVRTPNTGDFDIIDYEIKKVCGCNPCNTFIKIETGTNIKPVQLLNKQTSTLEQSVCKSVNKYMHINSGAGHDSQIIAPFVPTSMLFVPSHLGYSHRPDEFTEERFLFDAAKILCDFFQE